MLRTDAAALLERETELSQLAELVQDACAGRGRLVLLEGPPGIGKTRLLDAGRAEAQASGITVLAARASELEREFPFGVVRQLFEPLVRSAAPERRAALLNGAAAAAAPLVGADRSDAGDVDALTRLHALYWLTANLADDAPLFIAVDDLHWADAASIQFLRFLLPRLDGMPVLVGAATRHSDPGADQQAIDALAADAHALVVRPDPLSAGAVGALVAERLGTPADPRFADACRDATGGNPFLLQELVRELKAKGIARADDVRDLAPPAVARAVLLRLARLGDDASALARAVAVLGDGPPRHRVHELTGLADERIGEVAAALSQADILTPARPLAFAHPILRSAVYADMGASERAASHRRAAAILAAEGAEPDAIAVHLLATEPAADGFVVATLREAAARAEARGAAAVAAACLRRALSEPPPASDRGPLLLALASAELKAGEPAAAVDHFEQAAVTGAGTSAIAASAWEHAVALQAIGRHEEGFALRERAVERVAGTDQRLALSIEASLVASARLDLNRLDWARARLDRHRDAGPGDAPADHALRATRAHLDAFTPGCEESADTLAKTAERAIAAGALSVQQRGLATPFYSAVEVLVLADRIALARRALDATIDEARRRGSAVHYAFASGARAGLRAREGALADAEADARICAELSLPQGWFVMGPVVLGFVLEALIDRGEIDYAEDVLRRSGMGDRPADQDLTFDPVVHARARLRAARGDVAGGRADLASLARRKARWNTYATLVPAVILAPELGEPVDAERTLEEAHTWGTPRAIGIALHAAGLRDGDIGLLEQAVATLELSPARVEHARALTDLGAALRRANRRADARDPLRAALDIADGCGARPLAARARSELRAAGGRPRRPRTEGIEALTASERRIAVMAAEGLSNPEIAQALFVTKKTVEAHLRGAYRKLGITSRLQLGAALRG